MNFLADESVDRQIVSRLRQDGHTVQYVAEMEPGISDDIVLDQTNRAAAILLTADKLDTLAVGRPRSPVLDPSLHSSPAPRPPAPGEKPGRERP